MSVIDQDDGRFDEPPKLFVVDDNPDTLGLFRDLADDVGWEAIGFTRLAELRAALERDRPTMLILDDDLPDGRGGDLARDLRDDPRLADVPLVVCTAAHPMRQAEITAWAPVISKPFDVEQVESILVAAGRRASASDRGDSYGRAG